MPRQDRLNLLSRRDWLTIAATAGCGCGLESLLRGSSGDTSAHDELDAVRMCVPRFIASSPHSRLAISQTKLWRGRTKALVVRFLRGDAATQAKVIEFANGWTPYTGIPFVPWKQGAAHIVVDFKLSGSQSGHWSLLGTDAILSPYADRQTLNLQFSARESQSNLKELRRVTLHEFGHALGAIHEHQSPQNHIPWIRSKVYAWYAKYTDFRDPRTVDAQVLSPSREPQVTATEWDPHSIMEYPIDPNLVDPSFREQALATQANDDLSPRDRTFMAQLYGVSTASPTTPAAIDPLVIDGPAVAGEIKQPGQKQLYSFMIKDAGNYLITTAGHTCLIAQLWGPGDPQRLVCRTQPSDSPDLFNIRWQGTFAPGSYWLGLAHAHCRGLGNFTLRIQHA